MRTLKEQELTQWKIKIEIVFKFFNCKARCQMRAPKARWVIEVRSRYFKSSTVPKFHKLFKPSQLKNSQFLILILNTLFDMVNKLPYFFINLWKQFFNFIFIYHISKLNMKYKLQHLTVY